MLSKKLISLSLLLTALLVLMLLVCLVCTKTVFADSAKVFYEGHAEGWHWYADPKKEAEIEEIEEEQKEQKEQKGQSLAKDPNKEMDALRAAMQRALNKAILYPTEANIKDYIDLQNRLSNQSTIFADIWQKVLLENPGLNYALVHPTNALAKQVDLDFQTRKENEAIAKLAEKSGLFFFYSSSCAYCHKFAPIVKRFAVSHNITVIPITLDGIALPEFPNSKTDMGQAAKFSVSVYPSLFAVNPYTKKAYPISYGLISEDALRKRILDIAQNFRGGI